LGDCDIQLVDANLRPKHLQSASTLASVHEHLPTINAAAKALGDPLSVRKTQAQYKKFARMATSCINAQFRKRSPTAHGPRRRWEIDTKEPQGVHEG
jgi:hypothetical protein